MIQKKYYNFIYLFLVTSFFFLWDVRLLDLYIGDISLDNELFKKIGSINLNIFIVLLLIPKFYTFYINKNFFNNQKHIKLLVFFVTIHFFVINFFYNNPIGNYEIVTLFFFIISSIIYAHYRNYLAQNLEKILILFFIIFIPFAIGSEALFNDGQCNKNFFLINVFSKTFNINLTNSIFLENSHLGMMMSGVFFSSLFFITEKKKNNKFFIIIFFISVIILMFNYSTTFFVGYLISFIVFLVFFLKKLSSKFWIISALFLFCNSILFFSDNSCVKKISQFNTKDVISKNTRKSINLTTYIYQRSAMVTLETLYHQPLGWGIEGMDNATVSFLSKKMIELEMELLPLLHWPSNSLNLKDGLSNLFKLMNEFGYFILILFYFFVKYLFNLKKINPYDIFIITLFITMLIRGAGYFNGGFLFCVLELFYIRKSSHKIKDLNTKNIF